jgi:hypothetical protein
MKENTALDATTLLKEAEASEHQEAYRTLKKSLNYRIGVGVRFTPSNLPHFFVEILIYLSSDERRVDLQVLEKSLSCLRELQARKFKMAFQDDNCISCELQISEEQLTTEYELCKALTKKIFSN